ncbi:MAG: Holliday junction branch migration protein RuvA [Clostridia bacterium]|nr:Holliday junction branch migration protein RuvA [Clostridia bacterium]
MIASLRGKLIFSDNSTAIVECGGVGFKCFITKAAFYKLPSLGEEVFFHTHFAVREDAMDLYGFADIEELNAFKLITSVNGVGPKIGLALLSELSAGSIMLAVAGNDAKALTAASGVGLKLAQRIVLELKDKVGGIATANASDIKAVGNAVASTASSEAIEALVSLGYTKSEAALAVGRLSPELASDEMIKQALKSLARGL